MLRRRWLWGDLQQLVVSTGTLISCGVTCWLSNSWAPCTWCVLSLTPTLMLPQPMRPPKPHLPSIYVSHMVEGRPKTKSPGTEILEVNSFPSLSKPTTLVMQKTHTVGNLPACPLAAVCPCSCSLLGLSCYISQKGCRNKDTQQSVGRQAGCLQSVPKVGFFYPRTTAQSREGVQGVKVMVYFKGTIMFKAFVGH